jgi:CheY-like chemotaxis protein
MYSLEAFDGYQALSTLATQDNKIDLIITDLYMPLMNGIELANTIRSNEEFKLLPIILMTSDSQVHKTFDTDIRYNVFKGLLPKPFSLVDFTNLIKHINSNKTYIQNNSGVKHAV